MCCNVDKQQHGRHAIPGQGTVVVWVRAVFYKTRECGLYSAAVAPLFLFVPYFKFADMEQGINGSIKLVCFSPGEGGTVRSCQNKYVAVCYTLTR